MVFVDGENFTIRGQRVASHLKLQLEQGRRWQKDAFLWVPYEGPAFLFNARAEPPQSERLEVAQPVLQERPVRSYYYAGATGADPDRAKVSEALWNIGFEPKVFKKDKKDEKTKAVDIALCTDILSHAYLDNYDVAMLVAGDRDYVPLIEELKHHGKVVVVAFFTGTDSGLSTELAQASDLFIDVTVLFRKRWEYLAQQRAQGEGPPA
jgi:uncharacterized LabA/DUF88 family protein